MGTRRTGGRWGRRALLAGAGVGGAMLVGLGLGRTASDSLAAFRTQVPAPRAYRPEPLPTYDAEWDWANSAPRPRLAAAPVDLAASTPHAANSALFELTENDILRDPTPPPVRVHRLRTAPVEVEDVSADTAA